MRTIGLFLFIFGLFSSNFCHAHKKQERQTQHIAHYNSKDLKTNWSEWQKMELKVREYSDSLNNVFKLNKDAFLKKVQEYQEKPPELPLKNEQMSKEIEVEWIKLEKQKTVIDSQVLVRKQELEKPLNERLDNALQILVERKNYTYILDVSTIKIHINGGEDVTPLLREELEER